MSKLHFQRTLAVLVGLILVSFILFVTLAVTQYRPMADSLLETDRYWVALQDSSNARDNAANALIDQIRTLPGTEEAVAEFQRVSGALATLKLNRKISPFDFDRAGDYAMRSQLVHRAVKGLMQVSGGRESKAWSDLEKADADVARKVAAYNAAATRYNQTVRKFPRQYIATPFGFFDKPLLERAE